MDAEFKLQEHMGLFTDAEHELLTVSHVPLCEHPAVLHNSNLSSLKCDCINSAHIKP